MLEIQRKRTYLCIFFLYFAIFFYLGIIPSNIDNLLATLAGISNFGVSFIITAGLISGTASLLLFGYFSDHLSQRFGRKNLFILTNLLWIITIGILSLSPHYSFFIVFYIIAAIGSGAFLPIGFSIIGDLFTSNERGKRFGSMYVGLFLGNGFGVIFGGLLGWRLGFVISCILGLFALFGYFRFSSDPKRGASDFELQDSNMVQDYNYKITPNSLIQLVKTKTVIGILASVFCSGIATSTLSNWAIFSLNLQINNKMLTILVCIIAGMGGIAGAVIGGDLGDMFSNNGDLRGRIKVSGIGIIIGSLFLLGFYQSAFIILGVIGNFFVFFSRGNQFAIYSDVCVPELRGTVNALNGIMINLGGIVGNLLVSAIIQDNIAFISISIMIVILIWFFGAVFWVIPYLYYSKDLASKQLRMENRIEQIGIYKKNIV